MNTCWFHSAQQGGDECSSRRLFVQVALMYKMSSRVYRGAITSQLYDTVDLGYKNEAFEA